MPDDPYREAKFSGRAEFLEKPGFFPSIGNDTLIKAAKVAFCLILPLAAWLCTPHIPHTPRLALAVSTFMIAAWMTEVMDYAVSGLLGLTLFWLFGVAKPSAIFSGFVNDASWFYLGAMLIGAMASKAGLPQRIANAVISRIGVAYPRLLLGLIVVDFLLTFIVPSGAAIMVIMASICIGVLDLFGIPKGSNIGRGMFLVLTYTTSIFNKMMVAGTASIVAHSIILHVGKVDVSWALWLIAFLPCAIGTVLISWWLTLKFFPPEAEVFSGRHEELRTYFRSTTPWTSFSRKALVLSVITVILWMTDWLHHISASIVALGIGLVALLPFIELLDEEDFKRINLMPFFFVGAALGMSEVLEVTGGIDPLTNMLVAGIGSVLNHTGLGSVAFLYWAGFLYHFATASEVSMLATSMPILMNFAKAHNMNVAPIGMIWSFASGGKLFAYQSAVLVLGYSYGYFRHIDLLKLGLLLTLAEFILLTLSVIIFWPLLGLA